MANISRTANSIAEDNEDPLLHAESVRTIDSHSLNVQAMKDPYDPLSVFVQTVDPLEELLVTGRSLDPGFRLKRVIHVTKAFEGVLGEPTRGNGMHLAGIEAVQKISPPQRSVEKAQAEAESEPCNLSTISASASSGTTGDSQPFSAEESLTSQKKELTVPRPASLVKLKPPDDPESDRKPLPDPQEPSGLWRCDEGCGVSFGTYMELRWHKDTHYAGDLTCRHCQLTFSNAIESSEHQLKWHLGKRSIGAGKMAEGDDVQLIPNLAWDLPHFELHKKHLLTLATPSISSSREVEHLRIVAPPTRSRFSHSWDTLSDVTSCDVHSEILVNPWKREMIAACTTEILNFFISEGYHLGHACAGDNHSARSNGGSLLIPTSAPASGGTSNRSRRPMKRAQDSPDDGDSDGSSGAKRSSHQGRRCFACQYWKEVPDLFRSRSCTNNNKGFQNIKELKRHLRRVHRAGIRDKTDSKDKIGPEDETDLFSDEALRRQYIKLYNLGEKTRVSLEQKWEIIYRLIYPGCRVPSCYYDPIDVSEESPRLLEALKALDQDQAKSFLVRYIAPNVVNSIRRKLDELPDPYKSIHEAVYEDVEELRLYSQRAYGQYRQKCLSIIESQVKRAFSEFEDDGMMARAAKLMKRSSMELPFSDVSSFSARAVTTTPYEDQTGEASSALDGILNSRSKSNYCTANSANLTLAAGHCNYRTGDGAQDGSEISPAGMIPPEPRLRVPDSSPFNYSWDPKSGSFPEDTFYRSNGQFIAPGALQKNNPTCPSNSLVTGGDMSYPSLPSLSNPYSSPTFSIDEDKPIPAARSIPKFDVFSTIPRSAVGPLDDSPADKGKAPANPEMTNPFNLNEFIDLDNDENEGLRSTLSFPLTPNSNTLFASVPNLPLERPASEWI